uniref:Uncharacterized protein n=1 Tax=Arion vulgaris TaxID=1028688 RepID=A0A0B6ZIP2_9EUPU
MFFPMGEPGNGKVLVLPVQHLVMVYRHSYVTVMSVSLTVISTIRFGCIPDEHHL